MIIDIPYCEDNSRISNSNIGMFLRYGPKYLRNYLDGKEAGLKVGFLEKGTMIHKYILEFEDFWNDYKILDYVSPSGKQKQFIDLYINSLELEEEQRIFQSYNQVYSNSKSDKKILEECNAWIEKYQGYIEDLAVNDSKKAITFADLQMLKTVKQNIEGHKKANELLNLPPQYECYNEFQINWEFPKAYEDLNISCKSLLDRFIINHQENKIILVDVKTTSNINDFKHSMEEYDYYRQLAYYWLAIHWYFKNVLTMDISIYDVETYIIAIQNHGDYEVRVFRIGENAIEERLDIINKTISDICWHTVNNQWDHHKAYYIDDGAEMLI